MLDRLVRTHRQQAGLTQLELAERSGLSERAIRNIEAGRIRSPRTATVRLLADALGLPDDARAALVAATADGADSSDSSDSPDRRLLAVGHNYLAGTYFMRSMEPECLSHLDQAAPIFEALGDRNAQAVVLANKGKLLCRVGRFQAAADTALAAERLVTDPDRFNAYTDQLLGYVYSLLGRPADAVFRLRRALRNTRAQGLTQMVLSNMVELGHAHLRMNHLLVDPEAARRLQEEALALLDDFGVPTIECLVRLAYAETLRALGESDLALKQAEATLDLATRCHLRLQESDAHAAAAAALDATAPSRAVQHRRHSAAIRHELGLPPTPPGS